jgi:hypothetical protein
VLVHSQEGLHKVARMAASVQLTSIVVCVEVEDLGFGSHKAFHFPLHPGS